MRWEKSGAEIWQRGAARSWTRVPLEDTVHGTGRSSASEGRTREGMRCLTTGARWARKTRREEQGHVGVGAQWEGLRGRERSPCGR